VIDRLLARARHHGIPTQAGVSRNNRNLTVALREAEAALHLARVTDASQLVSYADLGPLRFLLDVRDTTEMRAMVVELFGPLVEHDARRSADLLGTLRAFVASGGHQPTTAAQCHIHISTLKYRLRRVSELLGRSLADPQVRFEITLGFEVLDMLSSLGVDVFAEPGDALNEPAS
jgi:DNA-binding PucR family transcriptional regulator